VAASQIENLLIAAVMLDQPVPINPRSVWETVIELEVIFVHVIVSV
jgi:hypothetical protein